MADMDMQQKWNSLDKRYKILFGLAAGLIVWPVIWAAVSGLLGLVAGGAIALIAWNLAPVVSMKLANLKIRALKDEASKNPIETLQNAYIERLADLKKKDEQLVEWETELGNYDDQIVSLKKEYPEEAPRYQLISNKEHEGLDQAKADQEAAYENLEKVSKTIKKMETLYNMAQATLKMAKYSKSAKEAVYRDIKEKAAVDSVMTSLNRSFAQLDMSMSRRGQSRNVSMLGAASNVGARLTEGGTDLGVEIQTLPEREKLPVRRSDS